MSKGGGRGSAQQMQQSALGGGRRGASSNELRATNIVGETPRPQFNSAIGGKGGQLAPKQNYGYPGRTTAGIKPQRDDMAYIGGTPNFDERTGQYRQQPFMPRSFPFQMPPRMPPQIPYRRLSIPGMNTQFQMPSFGQSYGQMNPYAGQFSGYGVPSNMMSFAQPHYQAYTPGSFTPPQQTRYTPTAPPAMQLPPGMGAPTFGGGYGGIGGFDRYNLGLAYDQLF